MDGLLRDVEFWKALPGLIWPVIAAFILWRLWPLLREVFGSRKFSIKIGGLELSVQEATDQFRASISDLQTKLADLDARVARAESPFGAGLPTTTVPPRSAGAPPARQGDGDDIWNDDLSSPPAPFEPGAATPRPAPPVPQEGSSASTRGFRILWVDDAPQNHATGVMTLRESGIEVVEARSSSEARAVMSDQRFDLILSDIGRPEGRDAGVAFLEQIRKEGNRTSFGFFSTRRSLERYGERIRPFDVVVATHSFVELLGVVRRLASKRSH